MLPPKPADRIDVVFDDHRLLANAGLILPVTSARHLGLGELTDRHVDPGRAPGRANAGDKLLTLVASALAGGNCIDEADGLRAGGTEQVLGCAVKAPSTLGTFLRSFRWRHVRQLERGSTIFPRAAFPPTPPGWRSKACPVLDIGSSLTTWQAGRRASAWASRWRSPRSCGDVSSPWPDASPARPAASPCIFPRAGPGKTISAPSSRDCVPCRYLPDLARSGRPVRQIIHTLGRHALGGAADCLLM